MQNISKIKKLIKSDCAGYYGDDNYCCSKDDTCVFFRDNKEFPSCRYFEEGVLPLDSNLEFEYRQERHMTVVNKTPVKTNVKCIRCNLYFVASSNRQSYCEKCKKVVKREQSRLSIQKKRNKSA